MLRGEDRALALMVRERLAIIRPAMMRAQSARGEAAATA
jgi:hypothetical protein